MSTHFTKLPPFSFFVNPTDYNAEQPITSTVRQHEYRLHHHDVELLVAQAIKPHIPNGARAYVRFADGCWTLTILEPLVDNTETEQDSSADKPIQ